MKLYCLSGLGVDKIAFKNIVPKGIDLVHIAWIDPERDESLSDYSRRLFDHVSPEENYNLLGVSFGGMIATEFAKINPPEKLFLISTIQSNKELPKLFKLGGSLYLHRLIPAGLMRRANFISYYLFGAKSTDDKMLLKQILRDTDSRFLKWAMSAMLKWKNTEKPTGIRIHGSKDKMLPMKSNPDYVVENGGHFMIVNRGKEITAIINECSV